MRRRKDVTTLIAAVLLFCASTAHAVVVGQRLVDALNELRQQGLQIIFSSALIGPELKVDRDPGTGTPEEIARRILAAHGLTLRVVQPAVFSVVPMPKPALPPEDPVAVERVPPPSLEPLYEVDIYASRYAIDRQNLASLVELGREELDALTGTTEDALRVTQYLPGTTSNTVSARSHVRGGRDDELAIYFDGVPLFEPFHFKDVQSVLGILDPDNISTVDFYSGVFPARFGNRLSGVLDIQPRKWNGGNHHSIGASNLYFSALSQVKLEKLPVEWLASVRYGNRSLLRDLLHFREDDSDPSFLDALGRVNVRLGSRSTLTLGWLLLQDQMDVSLEDGERADVGYRDATGWLSWHFRPEEAWELRATMSRTERHTDRNGTTRAPDDSLNLLDDRRRVDTSTARFEATVRASDLLSFNAGAEWMKDDASYRFAADATFDPLFAAAFGRTASFSRRADFDIEGTSYAAYASMVLSPVERLTFDVGLRWDGQRFGAAFRDDQVAPRLTMQYEYDADTILRASWGRLAQSERPDELLVTDGEERFHPTQRATQTVLSVERRLPRDFVVRVEGYDKRIAAPRPLYENLVDPFALLPELGVDRMRVQPEESRAYGLEVSTRWSPREGPWAAWASYAWSEANDRIAGRTIPRTWDQRNAFVSGLAWSHRSWLLSGAFRWHSGWRRNELLLEGTELQLGIRNARAWPDQLSLDLRAAWKRPLFRGEIELFGEITNATDHENRCCEIYRLEPGPVLERETSGWLPRVYLFGATWRLP